MKMQLLFIIIQCSAAWVSLNLHRDTREQTLARKPTSE